MNKKTSPTRPPYQEAQADGTTRFAFNIIERNNLFEYNYLDVPGNFTRANIEYTYLLNYYTREEIDEIIGVISHSSEPIDVLITNRYNATKAEINGWIDIELGHDF